MIPADPRSQLINLRSQLTNFRSQLINLRSEVTKLRSQFTNLRSQLTNLRSQLINLRSQINNWLSQLTNLQSFKVTKMAGRFVFVCFIVMTLPSSYYTLPISREGVPRGFYPKDPFRSDVRGQEPSTPTKTKRTKENLAFCNEIPSSSA